MRLLGTVLAGLKMGLGSFPRITIIGEALIEMVHLIDAEPDAYGDVIAKDCVQTIGGGAAIAALTAKKLGALPQLISRSGRDAVGSLFHELLEGSGISASYLNCSGLKAPCRMVTVEPSGNRIVSQFDGLGLTNNPAWINLPEDADLAIAEGGCTASAIALLDQAKDRSIPSIICVTSEIDPVVLHVATHVIMTKSAAQHAFPMLSASEAASRGHSEYGGWFAVRDEKSGMAYCGSGGIGHHVQSGTNQDTLGYAIDIWRAAFAVGLGLYQSETQALCFADKTLEMSSQQHSGFISIPNAKDVADCLKQGSLAAE